MTTFEDFLAQATSPGPNRLLPGGVVVAANKDGIAYSKTFGTQSLDPVSPLVHAPFTLDTTMWIASCTKLMTAISVLQCVEKGLLNLDDDISTVLPEFKDPEILLGFEDGTGKPILERTKRQITLRMLLTHQSGMGYTFMQPQLEQYAQYKKNAGAMGSGLVRDIYLLPLLYEPGTSWLYSVGLDWSGQMVERVTNETLDSYMSKNIWKPLGMDSTTFQLNERSDVKGRRADMSMRGASGLIPSPTRYFSDESPDCHGGGGVFSCAADYIKILISLLKNDGTLLKPSSIDLLFTPCLPLGPAEAFRENRTAAYKAYRTGKIGSKMKEMVVQPVEMNHAIGGQVLEKDSLGGRKAGSLCWGGLPNLSWSVDRDSGIALLYCSQLLPPGDHASRAAFERFESAVYSGELGNIDGTDA